VAIDGDRDGDDGDEAKAPPGVGAEGVATECLAKRFLYFFSFWETSCPSYLPNFIEFQF